MYKILSRTRGVKLVEFYNDNNLHIILSNYGASIYEIDMPDRNGNLECITLTPQMGYYFRNSKYLGLSVGRVAGRLQNAQFTINNETYKIRPNENGNLLHSGLNSFCYKLFDYDIIDSDEYTKVVYSINIKDMEDGFPGDLEFRATYTLYKKENTMSLDYQALSSKDTLLNVTNHSYFNLSGNLKRTILDEYLTINKSYVGLMDNESIVLKFQAVSKEFDFRKPKKIGQDIKSENVVIPTLGYDHYFSDSKPLLVNLYDEVSGRNLEITSNYTDTVIYTNNYIDNTIYINGATDKPQLAIAIEPNRFSKILSPDGIIQGAKKLYNYNITYKFSIKEE